MRIHYTSQYLLTPQHKITVNLVGLGGTGSQVLSALARMHTALQALDHPGLHVYGWDPDIVTDANIGRQLFAPADLGIGKAVVLLSRINRFFGTDWEAMPKLYRPKEAANITVTCVDTIQARMTIGEQLNPNAHLGNEPTRKPHYWLDFGNAQKTGQVILGTVGKIAQGKSKHETVDELPNVIQKFPELSEAEDRDSGPSCSLAEALGKQDLFINSTLCNLGMAILWKLFREGCITHHGCYLNLDSMAANPIKI
jgi:PRTRC genetic system ThiF family protein